MDLDIYSKTYLSANFMLWSYIKFNRKKYDFGVFYIFVQTIKLTSIWRHIISFWTNELYFQNKGVILCKIYEKKYLKL